MAGSNACSQNGQHLPTSGVIKVLIIFFEYEDPDEESGTQWPIGELPVWVDDLIDSSPSSNPTGFATEYFHRASYGQLTILGDYLLSPQNGGVFKIPLSVPTTSQFLSNINVYAAINTQSNGVFMTGNGVSDPQAFNNWTMTSQGAAKIPLPDLAGRYDHIAFIVRRQGTNYTGAASGATSGNAILGYGSDTRSVCFTSGGLPDNVFRHELAHMIMGGNNFHCAGGGRGVNYWVPDIGGHSMLGGHNSALKIWNAWDRKWLGWKPFNNTFQISARNQSGNEVNGDLDPTNPAHAGIYLLRDFAETGDALRVKLPFLNPDSEYEQWLWLENHLGYSNNGIQFDEFYRVSPSTCILPTEWGLSISVQIDRENNCGSGIYTQGYIDHIRMLSADGMWEREFDSNSQPTLCLPWSNTTHPSEKLLPNPLTGFGDLDRYPKDLNNDNELEWADHRLVTSERNGNNISDKWYFQGHSRQLFRTGENEKMAMGTNPPSSNRMNLVGYNSPVSGMNVRKIYLNGVSIEILEMLPNGEISVEIKFDHVDIDQDVRWCAPDIVLNEIPTSHGNSLVLKQDKILKLDHGTAATRMTNPITFENEQVFTDPTVMHVKDGAAINLEPGSEMVIDRRSTLKLESGSSIHVQDGAVLRIKREGKLELLDGALLQVEDGGKVVVAGNSSGYNRGSIVYHDGARINLEGSEAHVDLAGLLHIEEDAVFHLSNTASLQRTNGKIYFRQNGSTEVTAGENTSWAVLGYSETQEVIINQKSDLIFPNTMINFVLRDLRVTQSEGCRIAPPISNACDINLRYVHFRSPTGSFGHNGLGLYGQENVSVRDCRFYEANVGIHCFNIALGNGLTVRDSYFENCATGIHSYSRRLILYDTEFLRCDNDWNAVAMTTTSGIQNVTSQSTTFTNIHFQGNAVLLGEESSFSGGDHGIILDGATGRLSCLSVKNQADGAMQINNGAVLFMNGNWPANDLAQNPETIRLNAASFLNLNNGLNDLRPSVAGAEAIINGDLVCPSGSILTANQNVWNNGGSAPTSNDYDISAECSPLIWNMTVSDNAPIAQMGTCTIDGLQDPEGEEETAMGQEQGSSLNGSETSAGSIESFLEALDADDYSELLFSDGDTEDQVAANATLNEVEIAQWAALTGLYSALNSAEELSEESVEVRFRAAAAMLEIFQRTEGLTPNGSASEGFSIPSAVEVHSVLHEVSSQFSETGYAAPAFWTGIWAAEILHIAADTEAALNYLYFEAPNPYDEISEMVHDRFICQMEYEMEVELPSYEEWSMQVLLCDGSIAFSDKSISSDDSDEKKQTESLNVKAFPNPTTGQLFLELSNTYREAKIVLYDLNGRILGQFNNAETRSIDASFLESGLYLMRVSQGNQSEQIRISIIK